MKMIKLLSNRKNPGRLNRVRIVLLLGCCFCYGSGYGAATPSAFQDRVVNGRVTSADDGQGFPGVNIIVKGTTQGTVTDANGNYSIEVPSSDAILVFSSIGYKSTEVPVTSQSVIDLAMETDITTLSEVVVVGYGTVKKSDVTGALSRVTAAVITERPLQNAAQALQGKVAGMNVSSNIKPGETPVISIRGNRSITASNNPLYVVDGVPLVNFLDVNSFSINDINPNDIASIEVLKDASATAIYGSRGANGVILVTTKKGTKGKVSVNYNGSVSLDSYHSLSDWMTAGQYIDQWREGLMNGRVYQTTTNTNLSQPADRWYPDPALDKTKMAGITTDLVALEAIMAGYEWNEDGSVRTRPTTAEEQALGWPAEIPIYNSDNIRTFDWRDAATRQGITNNHQISLSSGSETSRLYLSLGYLNQLRSTKRPGL
jgi:TonB-linked SusC/RagA family outer membrane protein